MLYMKELIEVSFPSVTDVDRPFLELVNGWAKYTYELIISLEH